MLLSGTGVAGAVLLCFHFAGLTTEAQDTPSPRTVHSAGPPQRPTPELRSTPRQRSTPPPLPEEPSLPGGSRYWGVGADQLALPLAGLRSSQLVDTFNQTRGEGESKHEALDIMAPRGTPVLAMTTGQVKKLFTSKQGGLTVYQFDRQEVYCFYYAHLDRYAAGIVEGDVLRKGGVLGYVGSTGNANPGNPHLHLAIFRLGPEKKWWEGTPINPYPILRRLIEHAR